jgi:predicted Zn-dependent protease
MCKLNEYTYEVWHYSELRAEQNRWQFSCTSTTSAPSIYLAMQSVTLGAREQTRNWRQIGGKYMTLRQHYAGLIMPVLVALPDMASGSEMAYRAVQYADALIAALDK